MNGKQPGFRTLSAFFFIAIPLDGHAFFLHLLHRAAYLGQSRVTGMEAFGAASGLRLPSAPKFDPVALGTTPVVEAGVDHDCV
ncbi:hypothetical protein, partial [Delftia acidovorans]|uniref:hypothetical protein n=1 Tax=Delftia acidovorans TaxID=80866 RepID=UPI0035A0A44D